MAEELMCTGERVIPEEYVRDAVSRLIYFLHLATYRFARTHTDGRRVLDFGCGTGYGTSLLAPGCSEIVGVDVSPETVGYAAARHHHANLSFRAIAAAENAPLPFKASEFDTVLSFQVIEHLWDPLRYLEEARRVLRPGGTFLLATPDRSSRLLPGQRPWNRFHTREYSAKGLRALLVAHFASVEILQMSGDPALLAPELHRTKLARFAALPFTFPGAAEWWRQAGLRALQRSRGPRLNPPRPEGNPGEQPEGTDFDDRKVWIRAGASPSLYLIAVARTS